MTRYFLTRIEIEGFRGINNENDPLELRFKNDAVNSIFAANSLGKSSVFEALCYAIQGSIPKLEGLHATERPQEYYCNLFHTTGIAVIILTLTPDDGCKDIIIRVQRSAKGTRIVDSPSGYPEPELLLQSLNGELTLIDHRTFMRFVEDTPLRRGRTFSALIGLASLSEFRQILEVLSHGRNLNTDFGLDLLEIQQRNMHQKTVEALQKIRSTYKRIMTADPPEPIDLQVVGQRACNALAQVLLLKPFFEVGDLRTVDFKAVRATIKEAEASDKRERLSFLVGSIIKLEELSSPNDKGEKGKLKAAITERDEVLRQTRGSLFQRLYNTIHKIYETRQWDDPYRCPACESKLDHPLTETITNCLQEYTKVSECQAKIVELWNAAIWVSRIKSLEELEALGIGKDERKFVEFDGIFRYGFPTEKDGDEAIAALDWLEERREAKRNELESEKKTLEKELPPSLVTLTEQVEGSEQLQRAMAEYQQYGSAEKGIRHRLSSRLRWARFIGDACSAFCSAEVALSTSLTKSIEGQHRQMYEAITKNPEVVPALRKAAGSEELHLRLQNFYGLQDRSAGTLLAESYVNAFAISLFLGAAMKTKGTARFMVLDDITSSFDAGHQYNLMELLRTQVAFPSNPNGPQVILLSHDGLLEKYFDTVSNKGSWHHQRLQGLPPKGSVHSQAQDANRLRVSAETFLKAGQVEQASPIIRQYLEYCLLQVIRKVNIAVPLDFSIRDDRKMVANCLEAIKEGIKLYEMAGTIILQPQQVTDIRTVQMPALVLNWVNHYPTGIAISLSPYVLLGVLDAVDRFADSFKYNCSCSGPPAPRFYKSLAEKHCGC